VAALASTKNALDFPTLLVRGRNSDVISDEGIDDLRRILPQTEVFDVAGAGHMVAGDRNDAFNAGVIGFLERHLPAHMRAAPKSY
jgi:pimeloyl-ACP methyl ester carboxylesterase